MAGLPRDLDDGVTFEDHEADPGRAQVVGPRVGEAAPAGCRLISPPAPVAVVGLGERLAVVAREQEPPSCAALALPVRQVFDEGRRSRTWRSVRVFVY